MTGQRTNGQYSTTLIIFALFSGETERGTKEAFSVFCFSLFLFSAVRLTKKLDTTRKKINERDTCGLLTLQK